MDDLNVRDKDIGDEDMYRESPGDVFDEPVKKKISSTALIITGIIFFALLYLINYVREHH